MGETEISPVGSKICIAIDESTKRSSSPESLSANEDDPATASLQQCTECGKTFSKPSKLRTHMYLHSGERPFVCSHPGCNKAYTSSSHVLRHMKSHDKRDDSDITALSTMHICEVCKGIFRSAGGLRKHVKMIHESIVKTYPCKECGEAFRKKKLLARHMEKHGSNPTFKCEVCTIICPTKRHLARHMRGHKTHPCKVPGCNEVLKNWSLYRKHMATHNISKGNMCKLCDKHFRNRQCLYDHMEVHRQGVELNCPYSPCEKTYRHKRNLNQHILTHHIGVRYICYYDDCESKFISKQKLVSHIQHVHGGEGGPPAAGDEPRSPKARAPRKDKGSRKRAMAPKLAGLWVPYAEEKRLLNVGMDDVQSPESGMFSLSGSAAGGSEGIASDWSDSPAAKKRKYKKAEDDENSSAGPTDASDLQGPSETQRRNEDTHGTSSDESFMYSGGESSDDDSGSGHCDDDDDEEGDGDDGGDDDHDDDDDDDDFQEDDDDDDDGDDDEGEEGNGVEEEGDEERDDASHLAQGEGSNGKRAGSESLSKDEIHDGAGEFGVDRDGTAPTGDSDEIGSPDSDEKERTMLLSTEEVSNDPLGLDNDSREEEEQNQRGLKRKSADDDCSRKKHKETNQKDDCILGVEAVDKNGSPDVSPCENESLVLSEPPVNIKHLDRNVDPKIFEVSLPKEKASKQLPKEVWVSTFQKSVENCLPVKEETDYCSVKREPYS